MYYLLKQTLFNRQFYKTEYKKISRFKVLLYVSLISILFSVIVTPQDSYLSYKNFNLLKSEINKIPPALNIYITNGKLDANFSKPLVLNLINNTKVIVDPKNSYQNYEENVNYIFLRERGFVFISNNNITNRNYNQSINLGVSSKQLTDIFNSINVVTITVYFTLIFFILNFGNSLLAIFWISVTFGGILYFTQRIFSKINLTYFLSCKKIIFLSPYYLIGVIISLAFNVTLFNLPFILLLLAYFLLVIKNS